MMSSVYRTNGSVHIYSKGAAEVLLEKCRYYRDSSNDARPIGDDFLAETTAQAEKFENEAYRVLAIAAGEGESEENLTFLGLVAIMDLPRAEVPDAVSICKKAGIRTMMITGDNAHTAAAIAGKIGMEFGRIIKGDELERIGGDEEGNTRA